MPTREVVASRNSDSQNQSDVWFPGSRWYGVCFFKLMLNPVEGGEGQVIGKVLVVLREIAEVEEVGDIGSGDNRIGELEKAEGSNRLEKETVVWNTDGLTKVVGAWAVVEGKREMVLQTLVLGFFCVTGGNRKQL